MVEQVNAVLIDGYGGPEVMRFAPVPRPAPKPGEVLVRLHAAGVNPVDWKIRDGARRERMQLIFPAILGCDLSGTVVALGEGVTGWAVGDAVFAMLGLHGAFIEQVCVPAHQLVAKPAALDHAHAAAVPLASLTAWQGLQLGGIAAGQRVFVHAAAGGVGGFAVQIALALGAHVTASCAPANAEYVRDLGADVLVDSRAPGFEASVQPVDLVLDLLGGDVQLRSWQMLRPGGALVSTVGITEAAVPPGMRASRIGVRPIGTDLAEIATLIDRGTLRVHLAATLNLRDAAAALEQSKSGHVRGKIVLLA